MFQWPKRGDAADDQTQPFRDYGDLAGQVAVISGSTSGIGLALARAVAAHGGDVVLNGLGDPAEIERTRAELEASCGVRVRYHAADMTRGDEVADMVAYAKHQLGRLDILVNNAGCPAAGSTRRRRWSRAGPRPLDPTSARCAS